MPASSAWSKPTRTLGSCCRGSLPRTLSSEAGLSFAAQPPALTVSVRRIEFAVGMSSLYRLKSGAENRSLLRHRVTEKNQELEQCLEISGTLTSLVNRRVAPYFTATSVTRIS